MYHCNLICAMCNSFDWFPLNAQIGCIVLGSNPRLNYTLKNLRCHFLHKYHIYTKCYTYIFILHL